MHVITQADEPADIFTFDSDRGLIQCTSMVDIRMSKMGKVNCFTSFADPKLRKEQEEYIFEIASLWPARIKTNCPYSEKFIGLLSNGKTGVVDCQDQNRGAFTVAKATNGMYIAHTQWKNRAGDLFGSARIFNDKKVQVACVSFYAEDQQKLTFDTIDCGSDDLNVIKNFKLN